MKRFVVGMSGSSGPYLGVRLMEVLAKIPEVETHLVVSETVAKTLSYEAPDWSLERLNALASAHYPIHAVDAPIASGSYPTDGMVLIPCSMRTLGAVAHGMGDNLLTRAADVTLKERRPLIVVPRETPLNLAHLRNMAQITEMGGIILPPVMAFYHQPRSVQEMVDHTVGKALDLLKISHDLYARWQGPKKK